MKKKILWTSVIIMFLFCVLLGAYYFCFYTSIKIEYRDDSIEVNVSPFGDSNYILDTIYYSKIESVDLVDTIYGNIHGDGMHYSYAEIGMYYNEKYGYYNSYVHEKSDLSVVIKLKPSENGSVNGPKVIIGLKSEKKTKELYEFLLEKMNK